jgi:hypothetical protein
MLCTIHDKPYFKEGMQHVFMYFTIRFVLIKRSRPIQTTFFAIHNLGRSTCLRMFDHAVQLKVTLLRIRMLIWLLFEKTRKENTVALNIWYVQVFQSLSDYY